jgi:hypothetical protein
MNHITAATPSDRLTEAIAAAIANDCIAADGRAVRRGGWTAYAAIGPVSRPRA